MTLPPTNDPLMRDLYLLAGTPGNEGLDGRLRECDYLRRLILDKVAIPGLTDEEQCQIVGPFIKTVANWDATQLAQAGADLVGLTNRTKAEIEEIIGALYPKKQDGLEARLLLAGDRIGIKSARNTRPKKQSFLSALQGAIIEFLKNEDAVRSFKDSIRPQRIRDSASVSPALRRLLGISRRMAAELDVAGKSAAGEDLLLSAGLYVVRAQEAGILRDLRSDGYDKPIVVWGDAGQGKSSLLWSLHRQLTGDPSQAAFLISATALMGADASGAPNGGVSRLDLGQVVAEVKTADRIPFILIDTADLLLHDDVGRTLLLDTCDALTDAGARLLLTCRPEERLALPTSLFGRQGLEPYNPAELDQAVRAYAAVFCPKAQPLAMDDKVAVVVSAVARGLTVREICQNPLMLRLLFELSSPDFPTMEVDVSGLLQRLWNRRIASDSRSEFDLGVPDADLSAEAEDVGVALLVAGRVELGHELLTQQAAAIAEGWRTGAGTASSDTSQKVAEGMKVLTRRTVLTRSEYVTRFFHQLMFEYAAARGLLARDGVRAVTFLADHLRAHPEDLFVGAVLEQVLIFALGDPHMAEHVGASLEGLASGKDLTLQRIALGAIAHHPRYTTIAQRLIRLAETEARRRYARVVPSVAGIDEAAVVSTLSHVWRDDEHCRMTVLEAFERLAARKPPSVIGALRDLDCVGYTLSLSKDATPTIRALCRVLAVAGSADPTWAADQLLRVFDASVASSRKGREIPLYILGLIADHWTSLGSGELAATIQRKVVTVQEKFDASALEMRVALGRILAGVWEQKYPLPDVPSAIGEDEPHDSVTVWLDLVGRVCESIGENDYDILANSQLAAIALRLQSSTVGAGAVNATVNRLLQMDAMAASRALARFVLPMLLRGNSASTDAAQRRLIGYLRGLPVAENVKLSGDMLWTAAVRESLRNRMMSPTRVSELLTLLPEEPEAGLWFAEDGLAALLVKAALGGYPAAHAALAEARANPAVFSPKGRDLVSGGIAGNISLAPELVDLLVDLSLVRLTAAPLSEVVLEWSQLVAPYLARRSDRLQELISRLLNSGGDEQRDAASLWLRFDAIDVIPAPNAPDLANKIRSVSGSPAAVGNLLRLAAQAAIKHRLDRRLAHELLRACFDTTGQPPALISPGKGRFTDVAKVARESWLQMICRCWPLDDCDVSQLLSIAKAAPATSDLFGSFGHLISRQAVSGRAKAAANTLVAVANQAVAAGLTPKAEGVVANNLRSAMRKTLSNADVATRRWLLDQIPTLPPAHARILAAAAAQECFDAVRDVLADLLNLDLPRGVKGQIVEDMNVRRRQVARGALPRLLLPL